MFAILENGSVETMLRYRLRFSTGRAFAIPTGQSKSPDGLANARRFLRTSIAGRTMSIIESLLVLWRRPSRATRLLASESTPRGDILALQPVHRSRWTACRRGSAAPPTMVLEENIRVSCVSLPALLGGFGWWRGRDTPHAVRS